MLASGLVVLVLVGTVSCSVRPVTRGKVSGPAYTLPAKSGKACAALCDSQPACDSANYEQATMKCKVFTRCSPALHIQNISGYVHFSKRPLIKEPGYKYHAESDSCIKLIEERSDYANADNSCDNNSGRLVSLTDPDINNFATELLKESNAQFAWIGATDSQFEGNPLLTDGRRVSETSWFPVGRQENRMDRKRNCWSLSDTGMWAEHSCKERKQFSICQIMPYPPS